MAEDRVQRRLTTSVAADVVGYSRQMALDFCCFFGVNPSISLSLYESLFGNQ